MTESHDAVTANELRITVEMGDEYVPSDELQSALDNLRDVLEAETDDVAGFGFEKPAPMRNLTFTVGGRNNGLTYGSIPGGDRHGFHKWDGTDELYPSGGHKPG